MKGMMWALVQTAQRFCISHSCIKINLSFIFFYWTARFLMNGFMDHYSNYSQVLVLTVIQISLQLMGSFFIIFLKWLTILLYLKLELHLPTWRILHYVWCNIICQFFLPQNKLSRERCRENACSIVLPFAYRFASFRIFLRWVLTDRSGSFI